MVTIVNVHVDFATYQKHFKAHFTPGQRVVKKGIELSLNMASKVKIVERNLGLRLFAYKTRLLMHSGIHKRSQNVVLSKAFF